MTTLDLRNQRDQLPQGLAHDVTCLTDNSLEKLKLYFECFSVDVFNLDLIVLGGGLGHISDKAQWAADIAAHFNARVQFEHNGTELVAPPSVRHAVMEQWQACMNGAEGVDAD